MVEIARADREKTASSLREWLSKTTRCIVSNLSFFSVLYVRFSTVRIQLS